MSRQSSIAAGTGTAAVFAVAFSVAGIITAELLPASLLTPMARDLGVSAGAAGQTISATAIAAMFASLFTSSVIRKLDRRMVLLGFSALMAISSLLTATAPNFLVMMVARVLLGFALGGFWSMSAAIAMRLVPESEVPKALSIIFGGVSVALVISAPLGTAIGSIIGWRGVFISAALLGAACWVWQWRVLPAMPAETTSKTSGILAVAKRPQVGAAMLATFFAFAGQFAFFTYMRPFYEGVTGLETGALTGVLLLFGLANFAGTSLSGLALSRSLPATLLLAPLVLVLCALGLVAMGSNPVVVTGITAIWGFAFGMVPVAWSTWVTRNLGDVAEAAGGLQVAVIQIANTAGAALGGVVLDRGGPTAPLVTAAALLALTVFTVALGLRGPAKARSQPLESGTAVFEKPETCSPNAI